jgi:uncharacterized protein (DUF697 family)
MKVRTKPDTEPMKTHWLARGLGLSADNLPFIRNEVMELMEEYSFRHPNRPKRDIPHSVSRRLIRRATLTSGGLGGATAAPAALPGVGTLIALVPGALADLVYLTKIQLELCYGIATAYEVDLDDEELKATSLAILGFSGSAFVGKRVAAFTLRNIIERTSANYLRKGIADSILEVAERMGARVLGKTFQLIPFLCIPLNAAIDAGLTIAVGNLAQKYFSTLDADMDLIP